jgi:hypothetical protein
LAWLSWAWSLKLRSLFISSKVLIYIWYSRILVASILVIRAIYSLHFSSYSLYFQLYFLSWSHTSFWSHWPGDCSLYYSSTVCHLKTTKLKSFKILYFFYACSTSLLSNAIAIPLNGLLSVLKLKSTLPSTTFVWSVDSQVYNEASTLRCRQKHTYFGEIWHWLSLQAV